MTATYGYWPNTNLIANVTYVNNPHPRTPATPKKQIPFSQIVEAIDMKHLLFTLTILLAGCATICDKKSCFQEISKQDFRNVVQQHPTGYDSLMVYFYAGSDEDYDYVYGFTPNVFPGHNSNFHYYKLKTGSLNLEKHYDFNVSPGPKNPFIITNDRTDAQSQEELNKLLTP